MSSGTNALKALESALKFQLDQEANQLLRNALIPIWVAVSNAVGACEAADYEDYMGEDM